MNHAVADLHACRETIDQYAACFTLDEGHQAARRFCITLIHMQCDRQLAVQALGQSFHFRSVLNPND